jgi:hypothetical protein
MIRRAFLLAALLVLPGCTAVSAVTNMATMPVRAASKAVDTGGTLVDATTTSQSERDERRGRELRLRDERLGELDRDYRRESVRCDEGDREACYRRDAARGEIERLTQNQPYRSE